MKDSSKQPVCARNQLTLFWGDVIIKLKHFFGNVIIKL